MALPFLPIFDVRMRTNSRSKFFEVARFPNVFGLIDGTHINLKAPTVNEHVYVNRKNKHSINCQVVCDWDNSFKDVVARWPGSCHDSFIWGQCFLKDKFQQGTFGTSWLLGDLGYACEPYLLTPYDDPETEAQQKYNRSHKKTRSIIERSIGIWKSRWRSMDLTGGTLCYSPAKVCKFVMATAILHNFCIKKRIPLLEDNEDELRRYLHNDDVDDLINHDQPVGALVRENVVQAYFS